MTQTLTCPGCHGTLTATRRTTLEQVLAVHNDTCPGKAKKATATVTAATPAA
jgi:uncharacterized protein YbaR (Trm112 family)